MSPEGEQQRNQMMASVTESTSRARVTASSSSADESSGNASSSSGSSCYGPATEGATAVRVKITWNGNPVANYAIRISQNGQSIGVGATDQSGVAKIYTNNLKSPQIDVAGCANNHSFSVSGSYCILDSSNYLELPLDVIAREIGNLMGINIEKIAKTLYEDEDDDELNRMN